MKKVLSCILAVMLVIGSFTGCGVKTADNDGKTVIVVGGWPTEQEGEYYTNKENMRTAFMEKYPDIVIERSTGSYTQETYMAKAASGQLPSVYYMPYTEVDKIVNAGFASDITEFMEKYNYKAYLRDEILDVISKDDKIYAVPMDAYAIGLLVNKDMFSKAGFVNEDGTVKIPQTMTEMAEMASKIKKATGEAGFIMPTMKNQGGWHFLNIAWAFGADFMENRDGKWVATLDSEEMINALQYVKDLKWKYDALSDNALIDGVEAQTMFASNRGAMMFGVLGPTNVRSFKMNYNLDKDNLAAGLIPEGPAGKYSQLGGGLYIINNNCDDAQIDAIFKWLDFDIYGAELNEDSKKNLLDTYKSLAADDCIVGVKSYSLWKSGPIYDYTNELIEQYANIDLRDVEEYSKFEGVTIKPEPPVNAQELYSIMDSCIQEVLINKDSDVEAVLKKAASDFQTNYLDRVE